ncbi:class I SAM-dependent methyltransferase [Bradyrhizobium sp.]|uniref:class I SAM-dependent methyltransferase n=1 Tax=Bradyrhizobium sp. TaxID=376 RepID=UPI000A0273A8|nr:class I SAM-dependent methyltransferase [Bradyrhizobium sp.]
MSICPACGSSSADFLTTYNGFELLKCSGCDLAYTAQRDFSTDQYQNVYSGMHAYLGMKDAARRTHQGELGYKHLWWSKRLALRWLKKSMPKGKVLDLGSGPGTFLMIAQKDFKYEVQGVEPASEPASMAASFNIPTFNGTLEEFEKDNTEKYDAIVSFEVLEHLTDPLSVLTTAKRMLKGNGALILSVPNLDDPYCLRQQIAPAMPPIHINFFSRRSLEALLNRSGFTLEKSFSLPIPTSSVRNVHGKKGFALRMPYLLLTWLLGRQDGTTLLAMARPSSSA